MEKGVMQTSKLTKCVMCTLVFSSSLIISQNVYANWLEQGAQILKDVQSAKSSSDSSSSTTSSLYGTNLSKDEIEAAFKQALNKGTETVVDQLGAKNGFNADPKIHIALPKSLKKVQSTLSQFGMGKYMDRLETKLNRAAEVATPEAKALFINAIKEMSFEDVQTIYNGPKDSATQYLKSKTAPQIRAKMEPIVTQSLAEVGAVQTYDKAISKYKELPFVPDVKADLLNHVLDESMNGIFYYIGQQETAIRKEPVKQTTELLKKVFGN